MILLLVFWFCCISLTISSSSSLSIHIYIHTNTALLSSTACNSLFDADVTMVTMEFFVLRLCSLYFKFHAFASIMVWTYFTIPLGIFTF